ncbi:MAG: DNA translocase FtsK 4TM domain-containing protein [Planctomycetes bacterium]|nr:DNA translocase FtsK 4TM domain-containing protein [Planctomycetota bacterium]
MKRKAVSARKVEKKESDEALPTSVIINRVIWIGLAMAWLFLAIAFISFDSADWPSHTVAVHNEITLNLCGPFGATIAYWGYHVIGIGCWVLLAGLAGYLGVTATGRGVTHPLVRLFGLLFMTAAISSFHELLAPELGPLAGSSSGLVAGVLVTELVTRINTVGTFLLLLAAFSIGAIVAVDRLVLAIPHVIATGAKASKKATVGPLNLMRSLRTRPEAQLATSNGLKIKKRSPELLADPNFDLVSEVKIKGSRKPAKEEKQSKPERLSTDELRKKIARLPLRIAGAEQTVAKDEDIPREDNFEGYKFPTLELLEDPEHNYSSKMESFVRKQAEQLEAALHTYHIKGEVVGIESGPVVTLYSLQLVPGTKVAKIQAVASDIARSLRAQNIRLVPNMVGKTTVGIEVPNILKERVRLKELMSGGHADGMNLPMYLGKDAAGEPLVADLTRMPHMLIAGTTGSGKSVCMNSIIMSWLYTKRPDELKLILVDPKMVELSQFAQIPHLMCPVVTEMPKAAAILEWAIIKMEERYELIAEARVRDVDCYNKLSEEELYEIFEPANELEKAKIPKKLPFIVFMIDELADLILTNKDVEHSIVRIAQKARAVGIHLIVATQRPQANVVTGLIKSNMPCRVSFKVASGMDSRIVLDQKGAELLLGQGDMLFNTPHSTEVTRAQGTLVTDIEIRRVVKFVNNVATPQFERSLISIRPSANLDGSYDAIAERDPLFDKAVEIIIESGRGSVSLIQRRLAIGYSRSSRLVDQMCLAGIIGDHKGSVAREVLLTLEDWQQMKSMEEAARASGTLFDNGEDQEHPYSDDETKRDKGDKGDDGDKGDEYEGYDEDGDEEEDDNDDDQVDWEDDEEDEEDEEDDGEYDDEEDDEDEDDLAQEQEAKEPAY